ncbi:DUF4952 domain-containing protein [uncultured Cocleimonas sp.]|uniref:DUF4952 domain-containing protein n=1 Tax=uncultured Cocleimonas sp. TaxID=1051587 RepID=UPI00261F386F|nr:DUF4952 domain-containing protein [uncultured Cocleimonas sp.]
MKITTLLLCLLFIPSLATSSKKEDCIDFLQELNLKPTELTFQSCKKVEKAPAVLFESYYSVSGVQAKIVEDFLHKKFNLKRLRFVCCGWETNPTTYQSKNGDTYSINMHSYDEYNFQEKWRDYKEFKVIIGKYIILP